MNPAPIGELIERELTKQGVDIRRAPGIRHARATKEPSPHPDIVVSSRRVAAVAGETRGAARGAVNAVVMTLVKRSTLVCWLRAELFAADLPSLEQ